MKTKRSWYSEKSTEERPSKIEGMVELWRCGKFIALVPERKS